VRLQILVRIETFPTTQLKTQLHKERRGRGYSGAFFFFRTGQYTVRSSGTVQKTVNVVSDIDTQGFEQGFELL
jgi:hypothetical protein